MSAGKYFLGAAALVGGVYYYDQKVQPILPRKQHQELAQHAQSIDNKANELNNKLTQKIDDGKDFIIQKTDSAVQQVKDSSIYKNVKQNTQDYKKSVEEATEQDTNALVAGVRKYIDFINKLGEGKIETGTTQYSTVSPNVEVKEKSIFEGWFGSSDSDKLKNKANQAANDVKEAKEKAEEGFFNWNSKKLDELDAKSNDALNWTNKQIDYASAEFNKYYAQAQKDWTDSIDNLSKQWEDSKKSLNGKFDAEKDKAIKTVRDAKTQFEKTRDEVANDPYKKEKLDKAKDHFQSAVHNLKLFGDDIYNDFDKKFKDLFNQK
ncbi:CSP37 37 kDa cell surface protein [Candida maltosa Xu316]